MGRNGDVAGIKLNNAVTLLPGFCAMSKIAAKVSEGATPPGGVAAAKRVEQRSPPFELTHVIKMSARELSFACGTAPFPETVVDLAVPLDEFKRFFTVPNAFARPDLFVALVPTVVLPGVINGAKATAEATVDTSLTTMNVDGVKSPQFPSADIRTAFGLMPAPELPPEAIK
jgi:hypothetical protein